MGHVTLATRLLFEILRGRVRTVPGNKSKNIIIPQCSVRSVMPNTHRRRQRDETVLSRRVGVGGVYMNSQL